jgi:hypothetical protein
VTVRTGDVTAPGARCPRYGVKGDDPMTKSVKVGDKVGWDSSGGHSTGKVVKKVTSTTHIKGHKVAATKDEPQFIVESAKSGKRAAHKRDALTKV